MSTKRRILKRSKIDRKIDYLLVDASSSSVFAKVASSAIDYNPNILKFIKDRKPIPYKLSSGIHGECFAFRETLLSSFTNIETRYLKYMGRTARRTSYLRLLESEIKVPASTFKKTSHQINLVSLGIDALKDLDTEWKNEYGTFMTLLKNNQPNEELEQNFKDEASKRMLYLESYNNNMIPRNLALSLVGKEMLLKFEKVPTSERFKFIKSIGSDYFIL